MAKGSSLRSSGNVVTRVISSMYVNNKAIRVISGYDTSLVTLLITLLIKSPDPVSRAYGFKGLRICGLEV